MSASYLKNQWPGQVWLDGWLIYFQIIFQTVSEITKQYILNMGRQQCWEAQTLSLL